jgi:hypothetical protein
VTTTVVADAMGAEHAHIAAEALEGFDAQTLAAG